MVRTPVIAPLDSTVQHRTASNGEQFRALSKIETALLE
jgi:hypothetical protein